MASGITAGNPSAVKGKPMPIDANQHAALLSVGHAVPPHRLLQSDAAAAARRIFAHRYAATR
jgi:hypothetical protein